MKHFRLLRRVSKPWVVLHHFTRRPASLDGVIRQLPKRPTGKAHAAKRAGPWRERAWRAGKRPTGAVGADRAAGGLPEDAGRHQRRIVPDGRLGIRPGSVQEWGVPSRGTSTALAHSPTSRTDF